ncbi:MAG: hypothetical protein KC503_11650 [Myxococcales bacterium]|nr:hypothetical protein [Myxococcales bacterium]
MRIVRALRPTLRPVLLAALVISAVGCGQANMVKTLGRVRGYMLERNYDGALATLRKAKKDGAFKEQDRVAFWMEEGMLLYLTRQYKAAADVFEKCENRTKELYTKSISKNIKAAFSSEAATDYKGEAYERVLLNVFKAFAYLGMGKFDGAMVEARKINEKLQLYATNAKTKGRMTYNQDAFAHWLMGLLFEMDKQYDDARIAYKKSWEVYTKEWSGNYGLQPPAFVAGDLYRAAMLSNSTEEANAAQAAAGPAGAQSVANFKAGMGEIILFHLNGEGPSKTDYFVRCIFKTAAAFRCDGEPGGEFMRKTTITVTPAGWTTVKIAFPQLITHPPAHNKVFMTNGPARALTQTMYPLNRIARVTLRDKMGRIFKAAIIRTITKVLTSKAAGAIGGGEKKALGFLLSKGSSALFQALEEADKRAWTTLPARIDVGRIWVKPGTHTVLLELDSGKQLQIPGVKVDAGKRQFIFYRTLP